MDQLTKRRLRDAIRSSTVSLVDHVEIEVDHDDLGKVTYTAPGLLKQLQEAVANGRESGAPSKGSAKRIPIAVNAHDLNMKIMLETLYWSPKGSVINGVIDTTNWVCRIGTDKDLVDWDGLTKEWVKSIKDLFDPPTKMHISAPCPQCNATSARLYHIGDKEYVRVPALQIMQGALGTVCKCFECGTEWPEDRFLLLANAIRY